MFRFIRFICAMPYLIIGVFIGFFRSMLNNKF